MKKNFPVLVWIRQDLRLVDNKAIFYAAKEKRPVIFVYIHSYKEYEPWTLGFGSSFWLKQALQIFSSQLKEKNHKLYIFEGNSEQILKKIISKTKADSLYFNWIYEPKLIQRDRRIIKNLQNIKIKAFHSNILFDPEEIKTKENKPYKIFSQFWRTCTKFHKFENFFPEPKKIIFKKYNLKSKQIENLQLNQNLKFEKKLKKVWNISTNSLEKELNVFISKKLKNYSKNRNYPFLDGTSKLSAYLHFGQIGPRFLISKITNKKSSSSKTFIKEIGFRDFSKYVMYHFPESSLKCLKEEFLKFPWSYDKKKLQAWQRAKTGYPIIDASINQLIETGWMHNRCRMIVASFLTKNLLQPWQEGAKFFYKYLVDADLSNNTMGWQWSSGCGLDAAPFFRIFNPIVQSQKYDPDGIFIKKYLPKLSKLDSKYIHAPFLADEKILKKAKLKLNKDYPLPIVDFNKTRKKALELFRKMAKKKK